MPTTRGLQTLHTIDYYSATDSRQIRLLIPSRTLQLSGYSFVPVSPHQRLLCFSDNLTIAVAPNGQTLQCRRLLYYCVHSSATATHLWRSLVSNDYAHPGRTLDDDDCSSAAFLSTGPTTHEIQNLPMRGCSRKTNTPIARLLP